MTTIKFNHLLNTIFTKHLGLPNFTKLVSLEVKYLILSFLFFNFNTNAQDSLSTTAFLATAIQQSENSIIQQQLSYQKNTDHSLPWLQELEIRTETDEFLFRQQEYVLRVSPNSRRQIKAQRQLHQANINLNESEQDLIIKNALVNRYEWLIKQLEIQQEITAKEALKTIYLDKLQVVKNGTNDANFRIKDLIQAEQDVQKIIYDLLKLEQELGQLNAGLSRYSPALKGITISMNDVVSQQQIQTLMALKPLDFTNHLDLARKQNRVQIIDRETEIELSEIKNPINYAQIKVGGGNNENFREYVSIGVGFQLPVQGDKKLDLNELELDKIEEQGEYKRLKNQLEEEQQQLIGRVTQLIAQQQFLQQQLDNSQTKFTYEQLLKLDDADPVDILDLREIIIKKENVIKKLDIDILKTYIEWLEISDKMMEQPMRNYLLASLELMN